MSSLRSTVMIANRALGLARLIRAGQPQAAHFYLTRLTFKIPPAHLVPLASSLKIIRAAAAQNDAETITAEAEQLLASILL